MVANQYRRRSFPWRAAAIAANIAAVPPRITATSLNAVVTVPSYKSTATTALLLNRRAFNRAIRTVHAAVARLWSEYGFALFAVVEKLASIGRHGFSRCVPAVWTGQHRFKNSSGRHDGDLCSV